MEIRKVRKHKMQGIVTIPKGSDIQVDDYVMIRKIKPEDLEPIREKEDSKPSPMKNETA